MGNAESLPTGAVISFGPFRLYPAERLLKRHDETLPVGGRALDILIALVMHTGAAIGAQIGAHERARPLARGRCVDRDAGQLVG